MPGTLQNYYIRSIQTLKTRSSGWGTRLGLCLAQVLKIRSINVVAGKERRGSGRIVANPEVRMMGPSLTNGMSAAFT
jgi:hypothetical protein